MLIVNDRDTNQTALANEMLFSLRCERRLYFPPVGFSSTFCHLLSFLPMLFLVKLTGYGPRISRTCFIIMTADNQSERREYAKFNGTNFPKWRFGVMLKIRSKKLEKIVLGTGTKPAEVTYSP